MKIPPYVRPYPLFFRPFSNFYTANAIYPWIFVSDTISADLQKESPSPESIAAFLHEEYHRKHQIGMGWWQFGFNYIFSRKFRLEEELEAYKITKKIYQENNIKFDVEKRAKALSGFLYLWATSYEDAKNELNNL